MPLSQNFTASQILGSPNVIILTDTSTGSDVAVTQRRAYIQKTDGTYLVPTGILTSYNQWAYAGSTINLNVLTQDTSDTIKVDWLNVSNVVLYTYTITSVQTLFAEQFDFSKLADQQSSPNIVNSTNYYLNRIKLRIAINDAKNAILLAGDTINAQAACDRATYLITNPNLFY